MVRGDCLPKSQLLAGLPKIHTHTLLIHLKEIPKCFYFLEKKYKKSTVKYLKLKFDKVELE